MSTVSGNEMAWYTVGSEGFQASYYSVFLYDQLLNIHKNFSKFKNNNKKRSEFFLNPL